MKIALDAKRALNNVAGLGQYSRILVNAFLRDFPRHEFHLYTPRVKEFLQQEIKGAYHLHLPDSLLSKTLPAYWRSYGMTGTLIRDKVEVYHGLSNELPLNIHKAPSLRKVVTIHDVIFRKHTEQYSAIDRKLYDYKTNYAVRHADSIVTISQETKQDLIRYYGADENKITVVYPSCAPAYYKTASPEEKEQVKLKYQLPARYILNVSSFFARKNHKVIIEAIGLLKDKTDVHVVFIGGQGNIKEEIVALIRQKKLENRFHLLSGVRNEEMPAIYQQAEAFVYPSFFEGFGIPVLEALYSKIPVITSKGGCLEEVGGKESLYVDPSDPVQLSEKLMAVLSDSLKKEQMIRAGVLHAAGMKDDVFASRIMSVYEV